MDERALLKVKIENYFNELIGIVRISNNSGNFDVNKISENRAISLFNVIYGFDLRNANNILSDNFPAVDLIDDNQNIAIQVTSTSEKDKIIYTIKQFIK